MERETRCARAERPTEREKINKSEEKSGELRIAIKVLMRVLLSRLLPVGGLSSVLTLSINHVGLKPRPNYQICINTPTNLVKMNLPG